MIFSFSFGFFLHFSVFHWVHKKIYSNVFSPVLGWLCCCSSRENFHSDQITIVNNWKYSFLRNIGTALVIQSQLLKFSYSAASEGGTVFWISIHKIGIFFWNILHVSKSQSGESTYVYLFFVGGVGFVVKYCLF